MSLTEVDGDEGACDVLETGTWRDGESGCCAGASVGGHGAAEGKDELVWE